MVVQQRVAEEEMASLHAEREQKARALAALSANLATYDEESAATEARVSVLMTELAAAAAQVADLQDEVGRKDKEVEDAEICRVGLQSQIIAAVEGRERVCAAAADQIRALAAMSHDAAEQVALVQTQLAAEAEVLTGAAARQQQQLAQWQSRVFELGEERVVLLSHVKSSEQDRAAMEDKVSVLEARLEALRMETAVMEIQVERVSEERARKEQEAEAAGRARRADELAHAEAVEQFKKQRMQEKEQMEREMVALAEESERLGALLAAREETISTLSAKIESNRTISRELGAAEEATKAMQEQLHSYQQRAKEREREKRELATDKERLVARIATLERALDEAKASACAAAQREQEWVEERASLQADVEQLMGELDESCAHLREIEEANAAIDFETQTLQRTLEKEVHAKGQLEAEVARLTGAFEREKAAWHSARAEEIAQAREAMDDEREAATTEREVLVTELNSAMGERDELAARHSQESLALHEMIKGLELQSEQATLEKDRALVQVKELEVERERAAADIAQLESAAATAVVAKEVLAGKLAQVEGDFAAAAVVQETLMSSREELAGRVAALAASVAAARVELATCCEEQQRVLGEMQEQVEAGQHEVDRVRAEEVEGALAKLQQEKMQVDEAQKQLAQHQHCHQLLEAAHEDVKEQLDCAKAEADESKAALEAAHAAADASSVVQAGLELQVQRLQVCPLPHRLPHHAENCALAGKRRPRRDASVPRRLALHASTLQFILALQVSCERPVVVAALTS